MSSLALKFFAIVSITASCCEAWLAVPNRHVARRSKTQLGSLAAVGNVHGQNACFLPLEQLDQDRHAPRIVQIAGAYPGVTVEEFNAVTSEPAAELGQWTYDFSGPEGPQMGTVALAGSATVSGAVDPVVIIAEHDKIGVDLPKAITEPVDLVVLVDRAERGFKERKFLVFADQNEIRIAAFNAKKEMPPNSTILGHVLLVQIPWLSCMKPTKTGFMEEDEYF